MKTEIIILSGGYSIREISYKIIVGGLGIQKTGGGKLLALFIYIANKILRRRGRVALLAKKTYIYVESHESGVETC